MTLMALGAPAPAGTRFTVDDGVERKRIVVLHECSNLEAFALDPVVYRQTIVAARGAKVYWVAATEITDAAQV